MRICICICICVYVYVYVYMYVCICICICICIFICICICIFICVCICICIYTLDAFFWTLDYQTDNTGQLPLNNTRTMLIALRKRLYTALHFGSYNKQLCVRKKLHSVPCRRRRNCFLWCLGVWFSLRPALQMFEQNSSNKGIHTLWTEVSVVLKHCQSAWLTGLMNEDGHFKRYRDGSFRWAVWWRSKAIWARMVHQQVLQAGSTNYSCSLLAPAIWGKSIGPAYSTGF